MDTLSNNNCHNCHLSQTIFLPPLKGRFTMSYKVC